MNNAIWADYSVWISVEQNFVGVHTTHFDVGAYLGSCKFIDQGDVTCNIKLPKMKS